MKTSYGDVVGRVSEHLENIGAIAKEIQSTKKGWRLDGDIINIEPPDNPCWFAFNKLRKLSKVQPNLIESICNKYGLKREQIKDAGNARYAIWIHCSAGETKLIQIIDWLRKEE